MTVIRGEIIASQYDDPRHEPRQRPDAHAWAALIREMCGWGTRCGDPAHVVDTPFRRADKRRPVDECELRDLARRQLADHQAVTP